MCSKHNVCVVCVGRRFPQLLCKELMFINEGTSVPVGVSGRSRGTSEVFYLFWFGLVIWSAKWVSEALSVGITIWGEDRVGLMQLAAGKRSEGESICCEDAGVFALVW